MLKLNVLMLLLAILPGCAWNSAITSSKDLAGHEGERVTFQAKLAEVAEQHPTGMAGGAVGASHYETYATLPDDDVQIVLVSRQPVVCDKYVQVEGVVRLINLYGDTGTKNEYSRQWVEVSGFSCVAGLK